MIVTRKKPKIQSKINRLCCCNKWNITGSLQRYVYITKAVQKFDYFWGTKLLAPVISMFSEGWPFTYCFNQCNTYQKEYILLWNNSQNYRNIRSTQAYFMWWQLLVSRRSMKYIFQWIKNSYFNHKNKTCQKHMMICYLMKQTWTVSTCVPMVTISTSLQTTTIHVVTLFFSKTLTTRFSTILAEKTTIALYTYKENDICFIL